MVHLGALTKRVQSQALTKICLYPRAQYSSGTIAGKLKTDNKKRSFYQSEIDNPMKK